MKLLERLTRRKPAPPPPAASALSLHRDAEGPYVLRIRGILHKAALDRVQGAAMKAFDAGERDARLLILLSDFRGWKRGDDWGNIDFFANHQQNIARIAVVGDLRWRDQMLLFLAAGHRTGDVRYYPPPDEDKARIWLNE